jgi:allantoinase
MQVDVVVKSGKIVTANSIIEAGVAIDKGKFVAIAKDGDLPAAKKVIDAKGNLILPGVIDEHVHFLDMNSTDYEDYITGSTAAAVGGVTTVLDMPLCIPATVTLETFEEKKEVAMKKFLIDFALYGGAVPGNVDEIPKMAKAGAIGFKAMMAGSVPGFFEMLDDGMLVDAFKAIADCGSVIALHAENDAIINYLEKKLKNAGRKDVLAFFESRPVMQEIEAISRAIMLAKETKCHLHIIHVSCPQGIDLIYQKKVEGQRITCETGPQYLILSEDDMVRLGPYIKFAPPVRSKPETEKLWDQLSEGKIETLGSDHGPHPKENKEKGWENIWNAGNGALAVETILPLMLSEGVNKNRISIQRLVSVLCENPAKIFGIYPQKGTIQVGSDADLVIADMNKEHVIEAAKLHSKQKHTPFEGLKVKGMPILTMVRGEVIVKDGQVMGKPGYGKFITRSA